MKRTYNTMDLPHYGQILTNKRTIIQFMRDIEQSTVKNLVRLLLTGLNSGEDYLILYIICSRLYYLSRLVYISKDCISKLSPERYKKEIFEGHAETIEEIESQIRYLKDKELKGKALAGFSSEQIFSCMGIIEELWCNGISCLYEQIYIPEMAYGFDYVFKRGGELEMPVFDCPYSPFPKNYKDFDYTSGIAEYYMDIMDGIY